MKKKLGLFLFSLAFGASFAYAGDLDACFATCDVKYNDCISKGYIDANYCRWQKDECNRACAGETLD